MIRARFVLCWALLAGILGCGVGNIAAAQSIHDIRIDPHPVTNDQSGVITRVAGRAAWIKLPRPAKQGATVQFSTFSDDTDVIATGVIQYTLPVAPYEAYVTDITARATRYDVNDQDDYLVLAPLLRLFMHNKAKVGTRSRFDGNGVDLAIGMYARTAIAAPAASAEATEPVRAHVRALRALNKPTAKLLADAVEKALQPDPVRDDVDTPVELVVDYGLLQHNLRPFLRLHFDDPILEKLFRRLYDIATSTDSAGEAVSDTFMQFTPVGAQSPLPGSRRP